MRVYLIRHGATKGNLEKRYVGTTDEPLCAAADAAIAVLSEKLAGQKKPEKVYVSPLLRARQTASRLFPEARQVVVDDLREMDFGKFEYKNNTELDGDPDYRHFVDTMCEAPIPGGETKSDFVRRTVEAFDRIISESGKEEAVYIVAHGGSVMSILSTYDEMSKGFYAYIPENAGAYRADVHTGERTILREVTKL